VHNDLCAEHVLVDAATGELTGVVDFGDALVGDPVVDFVGLVTVGPIAWVREVVAAYGLDLDASFWPRFEWLVRTKTLTWLGEAAEEEGTPGAARHARYVIRAFGGPW
jgi:aminoglycoside 2''-phosphotransferase